MNYKSKHLNRRDEYSGVNAAVTFDSMDAVVEAIGIYSRRVAEVFALKVTHSHPCERDIRKSIYSTHGR
ncbi:hypothetical protein [Shewanella sp. UCD-KL12]|uniref:hypothetical protein n=1 Tax=Shewanella sp. UCD-KL12 TaxID=1917163 RepID=UPI000970B157|nr:hypothetical protein [Shewanella sp. UCD-KL12]